MGMKKWLSLIFKTELYFSQWTNIREHLLVCSRLSYERIVQTGEFEEGRGEAFTLPLFSTQMQDPTGRRYLHLVPPGGHCLRRDLGLGTLTCLLPVNFGMQASCPQKRQMEHLPFPLAVPPHMVSPTLVWSALLWETSFQKELAYPRETTTFLICTSNLLTAREITHIRKYLRKIPELRLLVNFFVPENRILLQETMFLLCF